MNTKSSKQNPKDKHWLYQPKNRLKLWGLLLFILLLTIIPEFFIHHHASFKEQGISLDASPGFYAWFAFLSCVAMVVLAKLLGIFLKRREDYYVD